MLLMLDAVLEFGFNDLTDGFADFNVAITDQIGLGVQ
jgi:hypothetical protein